MVDSWNLMKNWNLVIPPSRPSSKQLHYLSSFAKKLNKSNAVAVLGSTMEFRDLLYELGFENIFVFDRNEWFYQQTSITRIYKNKEVFVHGNWIDTIQHYKDKFVLILSDLTSGNIPYDYRNKFYSDIENSLIAKGYFYDKVLTHEDFISVNALVEKYKTMPVNNVSINHFSCEFLFCSELIKKTEKVDTQKIYQQISELSTNSRIKKFNDLSKIITPEGFEWHYGRCWTKLSSSYCPNLNLVNTLNDENSSPYFKRVKIFHLQN